MQEQLPATLATLSNWTMFCTEQQFWKNFFDDLKTCISSLEIVSPFIRDDSVGGLIEHFERLRKQSVKIVIYSRPRKDHTYPGSFNLAIEKLNGLSIEINTVEKIHQKIAVINNTIWWEGSLNILSFKDSGEHMRRFQGPGAKTLLSEIGLRPDLPS